MAAKIKLVVCYQSWVSNKSSQQDEKLGSVDFLVTQKTQKLKNGSGRSKMATKIKIVVSYQSWVSNWSSE